LEEHSQELVDLTVPLDYSNLTRGGVKQTTWSEAASWEFDTKMSRAEYAEWINGKLRDQFHTISSGDAQVTFSRNLDGDREALVVKTSPSVEKLHVRVDATVSPD
jgi:hypothetical protein